MPEADDPRLAVEVGGHTVGAHLDAAIASGAVIRHADGGLELRVGAPVGDEIEGRGYILQRGGARRPCDFLNGFLFAHAYGEATPPLGCRDCFKIKVGTRNLRALMVMKAIAESLPYTTKSGSEIGKPHNSDVYATYIYFESLEAARAAYASLRRRVDEASELGASVPVTIKRGCTNYEQKCGPSDAYSFDPRLEAVEAYLGARFVHADAAPKTVSKAMRDQARLLALVQLAFQIGDETYKDFTGGQPLRRPLVDYAPQREPTPSAEA